MNDYMPTLRQLIEVRRNPSERLCHEILWVNRSAELWFCKHCGKARKRYLYVYDNGRGYPTYKHYCRVGHAISIKANTIFHKTNIPLLTWFMAIDLVYKSNGTVEQSVLAKKMGVNSTTAKSVKARIIEALGLQ